MHPAAEQEPALAYDQTPHPATLAEELSPPDLVYGLAGVLHDMKLVVYCSVTWKGILNYCRVPVRFGWWRR